MLATIPPPPGNVLEVGPLSIHYYGIAIAVGVVLAVLLLRRRYSAAGGDPDLADRTAVWAVGAGLIGARLAYVSTHSDRFLERPWAIFFVWEGGLAFFGGLLFGSLTALWYLRRHGGGVPTFVDAAAPAIPLAHAVGRWGNYFNEELYGTPTDVPWALELSSGHMVHPTFLYESLSNLVLVAVLLVLSRMGRVARGGLIFCYLMGYGVIRFIMEQIRTDTVFRFLGLSRNAWVALLVIAIGIAGLWWRQRTAALAETPAQPAAVPGVSEEDPEAGSGDGGRTE